MAPHLLCDQASQRLAAPMDAGQHRPARTAGHRRYLRGGQPCKVHQRDRDPLRLGQRPQRLLHPRALHTADRLSLDVDPVRRVTRRGHGRGRLQTGGGAARPVPAGVEADRGQPRLDLARPPPAAPRRPGAQVGLLHQVLGVGPLPRKSPRQVVDQVKRRQGQPLELLVARHTRHAGLLPRCPYGRASTPVDCNHPRPPRVLPSVRLGCTLFNRKLKFKGGTVKQATLPHAAAPLRTATLLAVLALLAAACGGKSQPAGTATGGGAKATTTTQMAMELPPGAEHMKVAVTAPADGAKVTANQLTLKVATSGYTDTCDLAGKPVLNATSGHYHVLIDKSLVNMYCTPTATVSMQNLKPGRHTLTVVPALNDHAEVEENAKSITIDYRPTHPRAALTDTTFPGKPSITILSPTLGATLGMSCQRVFHATTAGLKPGETHTLIALLVDNAHAPLHPAVESKVEVKIG